MKIGNFSTETIAQGGKRVSAQISWEDNDRPPQTLYFETTAPFAGDLICNPDSFLIAGLFPALYFGEQRLRIEEKICPDLRKNIENAACWIIRWFHPKGTIPVVLEAEVNAAVDLRPKVGRAGYLHSGGVDSLSTLYHNRMYYPPSHPGRIKDGVTVYGLEVRDPTRFNHVLDALRLLAEDAAITMIPIYTNIRELGPAADREFWKVFWETHFMGAAFSAVAHTLIPRFSSFSINSCEAIRDLVPYGSHPLVDPAFSSWNLKIKHEVLLYSRYEKTRLISAWPAALKNMRVCNEYMAYRQGMLNCGRCEKCFRTMLALVACNALQKATAFPLRDLSAGQVQKIVIEPDRIPYYEELIGPLQSRGRHDLAAAVRSRIAATRRRVAREHLVDKIRAAARTGDTQFLSGRIKKLKSALRERRKRKGARISQAGSPLLPAAETAR